MCDYLDFIWKIKSERLIQNKRGEKLMSLENKLIVYTTQKKA